MAGISDMIGGFDFAGTANATVNGIMVAVITAAIVLFIAGLWWFFSFNVNVGIYERDGNGWVLRWDKGKFKRDKDNKAMFYFVMMKEKRWSQPLDRDYVLIEKKGRGFKRIVFFAEDSEGRIQPMRIIKHEDIVDWKGWDNDDMEFAVSHARKVIDLAKKQDFWAQYGGLIQIGAIAIIFIMAIVLFDKMNDVSTSFNAVADAFKEAAATLAQASQTQGTQVIQ